MHSVIKYRRLTYGWHFILIIISNNLSHSHRLAISYINVYFYSVREITSQIRKVES